MNKKLWSGLIIITFIFFITFLGCDAKKEDDKIYHEYYSNGNLKISGHLLHNKKSGIVIYYYENGNIERIENYIRDTINGEVFSFYPSCYLEKKFVTKMGIIDGLYYSFYKNGVIKEYRKWVNGKKQGYGEDYWESDGGIKAVYFSRNDTLIYERFFDTLGTVTKTQGKTPVEPNSKVN